MQRLVNRIAQQKLGFAIGLLTASAAFGFWIWIIWIDHSAPWGEVRQYYNEWASTIHAGVMHQVEIPAWGIAIALPLAGFTVARAIQFMVNKFVARIIGSIRAGQ
jgi:hypothetical protein